MIAALFRGMVVRVEDVSNQTAIVVNMGRENLTQKYVGGQGYVSTPASFVKPDDLEVVACFDPEECEELANWISAMQDVDALADEQSPATAAAIEIEENARVQMIRFLHANSLARKTPGDEISPNSPQSSPADLFVERRIYGEKLYTQRMAVSGQGSSRSIRRRSTGSDC